MESSLRARLMAKGGPMTTSSTATPLTFDQFWRWLLEHRNCVVRAGAGDVALMDHELIHWDFFDEEDGRAVCQAILGKSLVGELVVERSEVVFVQASPDVETPNSGYWVFECIGGPAKTAFRCTPSC